MELAHSSTRSHARTEVTILAQLLSRSKQQHRSQKFLQHLAEVVRLGRIFLRSPSLSRAVLLKLQRALLTAGRISMMMIQLRHFLPLQTALIASYGRLYTLTVACLESPRPAAPAATPLPLAITAPEPQRQLRVDDKVVQPVPKKTKKSRKDAIEDIFGI